MTTQWQLPAAEGEPTLNAGQNYKFRASLENARSTGRLLDRRWTKVTGAGWEQADPQPTHEVAGNGEILTAHDTYRWRSVAVPWDAECGPAGLDGKRVYGYVFHLTSARGLLETSELRVAWVLPLSRRIAGAATWVFGAASIIAGGLGQLQVIPITSAGAEWTDAYAGFRKTKLNPAQVADAVGKIHEGANGLLRNPGRSLNAIAAIARGLGPALRTSQRLEELRNEPLSASTTERATELVGELAKDLSEAGKGGTELQANWREASPEIAAATSYKTLMQSVEIAFSDYGQDDIQSLREAQSDVVETLRQMIGASPADLSPGLLSSIVAVNVLSEDVGKDATRLRERGRADRALREKIIQSFVDGKPNLGGVIQ